MDEFEEIFKIFFKEILNDFKRKGKQIANLDEQEDEDDEDEEDVKKELKRGKSNE